MAWRVARSLEVLRDQIDAMAPHRNRATDGTKGDGNHQAGPSRHNPNDAGVVCALDITNDPAHGCPIHSIAELIRANPHPNLDYIISNKRYAGRDTGWNWHRYTRENPHISHAHFGVGVGSDSEPRPPYDDTQLWRIGTVIEEEDMPLTEQEWARMQEKLNDSRRAAVAAVDTRVDSLEGRIDNIVEGTLKRILTTGGHEVRTQLRDLARLGAEDAAANDG